MTRIELGRKDTVVYLLFCIVLFLYISLIGWWLSLIGGITCLFIKPFRHVDAEDIMKVLLVFPLYYILHF